MQELEKILEKMGFLIKFYPGGNVPIGLKGMYAGMIQAYEIIKKHMNDGWIPVERELPPNARHEGAFCPKYQVMTKYGVTEGWYNPNVRGWYVLAWLMTDRYLESEIDFDRGDRPQIIFLSDEVNDERHILTAWKRIEPYYPERSDE